MCTFIEYVYSCSGDSTTTDSDDTPPHKQPHARSDVRNLHACQRSLDESGGQIPCDNTTTVVKTAVGDCPHGCAPAWKQDIHGKSYMGPRADLSLPVWLVGDRQRVQQSEVGRPGSSGNSKEPTQSGTTPSDVNPSSLWTNTIQRELEIETRPVFDSPTPEPGSPERSLPRPSSVYADEDTAVMPSDAKIPWYGGSHAKRLQSMWTSTATGSRASSPSSEAGYPASSNAPREDSPGDYNPSMSGGSSNHSQ